MRPAVTPPSARVVLSDVDDLAEADLDALLAEELTVRPVDAEELARSVIRAGRPALAAHVLRTRAVALLG